MTPELIQHTNFAHFARTFLHELLTLRNLKGAKER
jgi:hypothetical protein